LDRRVHVSRVGPITVVATLDAARLVLAKWPHVRRIRLDSSVDRATDEARWSGRPRCPFKEFALGSLQIKSVHNDCPVSDNEVVPK
jgi:hypothetical protein